MADDDVAQTRSRCTLRWSVALAALSTAAVAVAGAIAFRRRRPRGIPSTIAPTPRPAPVARVEPPEPATPAEALGERAPAPPPVDDVVDEPAAGYDGWTVANLRTRARQLGVTGYSKLRKADLVAALQERDAPTG